MKIRIAAAVLILATLPAMADNYHQECQTIHYGKDDIRTTCTDTYTPDAKPYVPEMVYHGPGWQENVVYYAPVKPVPVSDWNRPSANGCGPGWKFGANGCESIRK